MINIGICDDDSNILNEMRFFVKKFFVEKKFLYTIQTFKSGLDILDSNTYFDLIFLDFEMPEIDGFLLAQQLRKSDKNVKIVYITNHSEYKDLAFSVHAFGYLVKPINQEKISDVLNDLIQYNENKDKLEIAFKFKTGIKNFSLNDITYFEYLNRNIYIHTVKNIYLLKGEKISSISEKMRDYDFFIPHKSFVVNMKCIEFVKGYDIHMISGDIIPLSQKRSGEFRKSYDNFLRKNLKI